VDSRLGYVSGPAVQVLQLASFLHPALMHSTGSGWVRNDPTGALKRSESQILGNSWGIWVLVNNSDQTEKCWLASFFNRSQHARESFT